MESQSLPLGGGAAATAPESVRVRELDLIQSVLENPEAQRGLVRLYAMSQSECKRNGTCGMEIGMYREKDQTALLKLYLGDEMNVNIDNSLPEDFLIGSQKVSIKHSANKVGTPFKAKWTSADKSVEEDIAAMIAAEDSYYPHLLLTYIDAKAKTITIVCISSEHNKHTIKTLGAAAFKVPKGNSRGIEYSTAAMKMLLSQRCFTVEIADADVDGGEDPIQRRMALLTSWGCIPKSDAPSSQ